MLLDGRNPHCSPAYTLDTIQDHPDWHLEVQIEREMLEIGADSFREAVVKAKAKGQMTNLRPVRLLLDDCIPPVSKGIREWRRYAEQLRGVKPISLLYLKDADPDLLAVVALRTVLDALGTPRSRAVSLAHHLGSRVEHELQCRHWAEAQPDSFRRAQRYFTQQGSTSGHRAKANVVLFGRAVDEGRLSWEHWPREAHFRVGVTLIDVLVRHTGLFQIDHEWEAFRPHEHRSKALPLIIAPKPGVLAALGAALERSEYSRPFFMPTLIPPRPWDSTTSGGYWTPVVNAPKLIRFRASHDEQRGAAAAEYAALDMPRVYQAVNWLQGVPWRVDRELLSTVEQAWCIDMGIGHLPVLTEHPLPPQPEDMDTNEAARKEWRRQAHPVHKANRTRYGRMRLAHGIVTTAQRYSEYDRFYFPHMLDFRGRAYCIPSGLDPQGSDLARGILKFDTGKPVTEDNGGVKWLALHLAGIMGHDKCPIAERLEWVRQRRDLWTTVADDPLTYANEWKVGPAGKGSKCWRALAAIREWAAYLKHGDGFISSLPVHVDGTCNGLQHLFTMLRDDEGGALVNLTPSPSPRDIYAVVANDLQAKLEAIIGEGGEDAQRAESWLEWVGAPIPRAATKRPVMVIPYGGTREAFIEYTRAYLDEVKPLPHTALQQDREYRNKVLMLVVKHLWAICRVRCAKAMAVMEWLQTCSRLVAEGNQPIYWTTPSGFVVRHFYATVKARQVDVLMDGTRYQLRIAEHTKKLDVKGQTQGVPPNFVHSLDAAAMHLTALGCPDRGITHLTGIHDAYGTHAADMDKLARLLREAFVQVHREDVLGAFWAGCQDILETLYRARGVSPFDARRAAERQRPPLPPAGRLDINAVLESPYFFL